jgi:flavin reductase (DIM6/NTAB) family NADH-FMN oxidoreductase RutF
VSGPSGFGPDLLRGVHRKFVTGVTVVTTAGGDGTPRGLAVNAFASISLEPPLIMVCVQKTSSTYEPLFASEYFAVNLIAADQMPVVQVFASKRQDKFSDVAWRPGPHGSPIIEGSCAHMEAQMQERFQASTHTVFLGKVVDAQYSEHPPLLYGGGAFYDGAQLAPVERS